MLTQPAFITLPGGGFGNTGIAFDGTNLFVSDIFNARIQIFNGTTRAFISTLPLTGGNS